MSESPEHLVKSYDQELKRLRDMLTEMGGIVESQVALAAEAIMKRDGAAATARGGGRPEGRRAGARGGAVRHPPAGAAPADGAATCGRSSRR